MRAGQCSTILAASVMASATREYGARRIRRIATPVPKRTRSVVRRPIGKSHLPGPVTRASVSSPGTTSITSGQVVMSVPRCPERRWAMT